MYRATGVMDMHDIETLCKEIQSYLEVDYSPDNPEECVDRAATIDGYMATSGKMLADSKYHLHGATTSTIMDGLKLLADNMTATVLRQYVSATLRDYEYLVDWCERLNRSCTHSLDLMRSIISKHKEEYRVSQYTQPARNG